MTKSLNTYISIVEPSDNIKILVQKAKDLICNTFYCDVIHPGFTREGTDGLSIE